MRNVIIFLLGFILLAPIWSCNPDKDSMDPVITYLAPEEMTTFYLPDTIEVKARITDNYNLSRITVTLVDENMVPLVPTQSFYPGSNDYLLNALIIPDEKLASNTYMLQIFATDGGNTKFQYRSVVINEIPRKVDSYIAVTMPGLFTSLITRFNSQFEADTGFVINQLPWLSEVSSSWGQFFFVSDEPSVITSYDATNFETGWEIDAAPPRPVFNDIFIDKQLVFGTDNGDIGIISEDGSIILRTPAIDNYRVKHVTADENYIYAAHQSLNGAYNRLSVYYRISGNLFDQPQLSAEITALVPLQDILIVFLQIDHGFNIMEYDPQTFTLTGKCTREGDSLLSVEKVSDNRLLLVTDRRVLDYNVNNCNFTDFTLVPYDFCRVDALNNIAFLAKEDTLNAFSLSTGNLFAKHVFTNKLVDFHILYNK